MVQPILLSLLFLVSTISVSRALTFSEAPYGAVVTAGDGARVVANEYEVVVVRSHPKGVRTELMVKLHDTAREILQSLVDSEGDKNLLEIYKRRFANLKMILRSRKKRWAVLEPIGNLVGSIFGLSTSKDMTEVRDHVNQIITGLGDQQRVIKGLTIAINDTRHNERALEGTIRSLTTRAANVQFIVNNIEATLTEIEKSRILTKGYLVIEAILSLFEFHKTQETLFDKAYQLTRDLAEVGHVTEDLVGPILLNSILKEINSPLHTSYIYRHFPVQLLSLTSARFAYLFTIPQLDPEVYSDWRIMMVPYHLNAHLVRVQPELSNVAIGHTSGSMIDTTGCLYNNPMLCPNAIHYNKLPCTQGILARNPEQIASCPLVVINASLPHILKISDSEVLLSGPTDVLTERCLGKPAIGLPTPYGTAVMRLTPNCTVSSEKYGWRFSLGSKHTVTQFINDEFLLKGVAVNFTLPSNPTLPPLDWSHLSELSNLTRHQLPVLENLLDIPFLATPNMHLWIGLVVVVLVLLGFSFFLIRKFRKFCPCYRTSDPESLNVPRSTTFPLSARFSQLAPDEYRGASVPSAPPGASTALLSPPKPETDEEDMDTSPAAVNPPVNPSTMGRQPLSELYPKLLFTP